MPSSLKLIYGFHNTLFGECLIALIEDQVSYLCFLNNFNQDKALDYLKKYWPEAEYTLRPDATHPLIEDLFTGPSLCKYPLLLKGTPFQKAVWEALLTIPFGTTVSYAEVAQTIGKPTAIRATASAVASNPVAFIVPCHRVIRKSGAIHQYRWGKERKQKLLAWEKNLIETI